MFHLRESLQIIEDGDVFEMLRLAHANYGVVITIDIFEIRGLLEDRCSMSARP